MKKKDLVEILMELTINIFLFNGCLSLLIYFFVQTIWLHACIAMSAPEPVLLVTSVSGWER